MNKRAIIITLFIGILAGFVFSKAIDVKVTVHPKIKQVLKRFTRIPRIIKGSKGDIKKDVLELAYFGNKSDLQKIEKDSANIELSREHVAEGKYSLKSVFNGAGAIGFYETIPSDWTGYDYFKFDVYSEDDNVPLYLFIADTNNTSYYDRYNREDIPLKKGWNSIEIPIPEIDKKLILDSINHLRIFLWNVTGGHILYFDNIRLTRKKNTADSKTAGGAINVTIYSEKEKGAISRLLYGTNLSPKMESDRDIWNFIKNTGITCFRYPGGESPGWHWKTGEADFYTNMKDMPLGKLDYLIKFCKKTDTKIIMQVNIESGTPEEAAELVEFVNNKTDFRITYWVLGGEVYGDWDKAYTTPQKYAQLIKEYSLAMKAKDSTIKIGANWGERYYDAAEWDQTIIKNAADYIDFVAYDWYPNHISDEQEYESRTHPTPEEVMGNAMEVPNIVKRVYDIIEKYAPHRKGKIEMAFLEWDGAWDAPSNDPNPPYAQGVAQWSLANAIFHADCLGQFAENGVTVSTQFNLQECMFGLIRGWDPAEGWGGMKWDGETIRPKAFAIKLFSEHFGDVLVDSKVENSPYYDKGKDWWPSSYSGRVPYITCYASKFSGSKKLGLILINKHSEQNFDIKILIHESKALGKVCNIWMLNGPDIMAQNDGKPGTIKIVKLAPISIKNNFTCTLPAHSVVAMEIE